MYLLHVPTFLKGNTGSLSPNSQRVTKTHVDRPRRLSSYLFGLMYRRVRDAWGSRQYSRRRHCDRPGMLWQNASRPALRSPIVSPVSTNCDTYSLLHRPHPGNLVDTHGSQLSPVTTPRDVIHGLLVGEANVSWPEGRKCRGLR